MLVTMLSGHMLFVPVPAASPHGSLVTPNLHPLFPVTGRADLPAGKPTFVVVQFTGGVPVPYFVALAYSRRGSPPAVGTGSGAEAVSLCEAENVIMRLLGVPFLLADRPHCSWLFADFLPWDEHCGLGGSSTICLSSLWHASFFCTIIFLLQPLGM